MREGRAKSNLIYENIYWPSAPLFIHPFLSEKRMKRLGFTITGMMGHARMAKWRKVN